MARLVKDCPRGSMFGSSRGELFTDYQGNIFDSSDCAVIHNGLDTVRQLYAGLLIREVYDEIERVYNAGFGLSVNVGGFEFVVSTGGRSGYRYILKNPNIGLIIMVGSQYIEPNYNGHHLKIQCSPVFLLSRELSDIQADMDHFAYSLLTQVLHTGVAVHICADVQGWIPPRDLDCRMTTRARRIQKYSGNCDIHYDFSGVSMVYGRGESFTFGKADSLQFSCYDKLKAVKDKGELPLWLPVWSQAEGFDEGGSIFRFEARFHHNVVSQFANGSGFDANKLLDLENHFTGLWKYALNNFRLDDSKTYINPFWQWLRDDLTFYHKPALSIDYKRLYRSPNDQGLPSDRAISICFGQLCSIYGRNGYSLAKASMHLQNSGIWANLCDMYSRRGLSSDDVFLTLECKLIRFNRDLQ